MKIKPKIGFCVIFHPFEDNADKAPEIFESTLSLLEKVKDIEIIKADNLINDVPSALDAGKKFSKEKVDVICVKLATWSSDNPILDMSSICDVPFIFWTYPDINAGSLCGGQQFNMVFKELGKECIFVYKDDEKTLNKIISYAKAVALKNELQRLRLLRIGNRTQGMSEVICDEFSIKEIFGPRVITLGLDNFKQLVNEFSDDDAELHWNEIKQRVKQINVSDYEGRLAIKNYLAMKNLIENGQIGGITIECYPLYMGKVCLGFSLLADEGIPGACEGDVNSLVLMYILTRLSGQPVHNIDILEVRESDNTILGSHCGCGSFSLAESSESISLENVRLANKGVCAIFPAKTGKITMANLVGRKGTFRMCVIEGEAIKTNLEFQGNPIRIKLPIDIKEFLEMVEEFGFGHHWIIAYGTYGVNLKYLSRLLGFDLVLI
ncbi:MAG: hypothetical protein ACTSVV_07835 [Promethearchaeota archaeon]